MKIWNNYPMTQGSLIAAIFWSIISLSGIFFGYFRYVRGIELGCIVAVILCYCIDMRRIKKQKLNS